MLTQFAESPELARHPPIPERRMGMLVCSQLVVPVQGADCSPQSADPETAPEPDTKTWRYSSAVHVNSQ